MRPKCDCGGSLYVEYGNGHRGIGRMVCGGCGRVTAFTDSTPVNEKVWILLCGAFGPARRMEDGRTVPR